MSRPGASRGYLTIVSGLPRSGTSMMMQMIAEGGIPPLIDNVRQADEDNPKGYYEFEPVKKTRQDASWVEPGLGKVVKMVHLLLLDLPLRYEYRVVFMRRNFEEVISSQDVMLERLGKSQGPTSESDRQRLITLYRVQINKVLEHMQSHVEQFKVLEVDYNAVMSVPAGPVERVSAFLDGLDTEKMAAVADPALYRKRAQKRG